MVQAVKLDVDPHHELVARLLDLPVEERAIYVSKIGSRNPNGTEILDKGGISTFHHALRIGNQFPEMSSQRIVGYLHDVVEDRPDMLPLMWEVFSEACVKSVLALTRGKGESYADFIERVCQDPVATAVKIEDIKDNLCLYRLKSFTDEDVDRVRKYLRALDVLHETQCNRDEFEQDERSYNRAEQ
jgi:hypothetical protein